MPSLIYRHNRVTRITHWVNALALLVLVMSGLQIFNAFPALHWGDKAEPDEAFFSIYATDESGSIRGYTQLFGWRVETTGFLGVQQTEMGPFPRAFPSWSTIPGYFWLAGGRRWHFFFAWLFVVNGLCYLAYGAARGHLRQFIFKPKDARGLAPMVLYYLRLRREAPQQGEYNPIQQVAYTTVLCVITPLVIISGLAMSPQLNVAFHWLPAMFGGRQSARTVHFVLTMLFVLFTFGHVAMVTMTGVINNMRSILTGWYAVKDAPLAPEPPAATAAPEPVSAPPEVPDESPEVRSEAEGARDEEK
jgi:Ni/Fe-hydrogenase b-type cytochrome subunit